ncbi:hypothetical protein KAU88_03310 [Candidatus Bathyarchaeota archaeon]|nr:hypothetical protein [Candidatus Bathyarchaeota archaeon]
MKLNKKIVTLTSVIAIISFLIGTALVAAGPEDPLTEMWEAIFGIQDDVEDLQTQIDLQAQIADLQSEVDVLKAQMEFLEDPWIVGPPGPQGETGPQGALGGFDAPDYDSGWVSAAGWVNDRKSFDHGLGTTDLFVYVYGRLIEGGDWVYHQIGIGWDTTIDGVDIAFTGMRWLLVDENTVDLLRGYEDWQWEEARVLIWVIS